MYNKKRISILITIILYPCSLTSLPTRELPWITVNEQFQWRPPQNLYDRFLYPENRILV